MLPFRRSYEVRRPDSMDFAALSPCQRRTQMALRAGPSRSGRFQRRGPKRRVVAIRRDAALLTRTIAVRQRVRRGSFRLAERHERHAEGLAANLDRALHHQALQHVLDAPDMAEPDPARVGLGDRGGPRPAVAVASAQFSLDALLQLGLAGVGDL